METTIQSHPYSRSHASRTTAKAGTSIWSRITAYCNSQEEKRFWWTALGILGHGTIFTIATFSVVVLTGNIFPLLIATCFTMVMVVVVNLAALPLRYVIPVFFLSLLFDIAIITTAIALWMS